MLRLLEWMNIRFIRRSLTFQSRILDSFARSSLFDVPVFDLALSISASLSVCLYFRLSLIRFVDQVHRRVWYLLSWSYYLRSYASIRFCAFTFTYLIDWFLLFLVLCVYYVCMPVLLYYLYVVDSCSSSKLIVPIKLMGK